MMPRHHWGENIKRTQQESNLQLYSGVDTLTSGVL